MPSLYICLERDLPNFQSGVGEGRALSTYEPQLAAIAKRQLVKPLMEFFSVNPEEAAGLLDDNVEDLQDLPDEQWFPAVDGLATIDTLLTYLKKDGSEIPDTARVLKELEQFRSVLSEASTAKVGWHLAVDY